MIIESLVNEKFVDENGYLTDSAQLILGTLIQQIQTNLSNEGYKIPGQSTENITRLDNTKSQRALLYDEDTNKLKININGAFKEILTAP